jgi:hypothetical protein
MLGPNLAVAQLHNQSHQKLLLSCMRDTRCAPIARVTIHGWQAARICAYGVYGRWILQALVESMVKKNPRRFHIAVLLTTLIYSH